MYCPPTFLMITHYLTHIRNCLVVRRLLKEHQTKHVQHLYWYDLRLLEAVSWLGMIKIIIWGIFKKRSDEIASNYNLVNLYYAEPSGDGLSHSAATVWNCRSLTTKPWFDEPSQIREDLEKNANAIVAEYRRVASRIDTHPDNQSLTDRGKWTGMFLYQAKGIKNDELCRLCPVTTKIIESLPLCTNFGFVMFSGLVPHSHITPHSGSSNLRLRHHLGIEIPEPGKAKIRVGREWRPWVQNGTMAFDDSFEHEVIHDGDQERIVLVIDVWHPDLTAEDIAVLSHPIFQTFGKVS